MNADHDNAFLGVLVAILLAGPIWALLIAACWLALAIAGGVR